MYQLKQTPEDFQVDEINNVQFSPSGKYSIFLLNKKNINTEKAVLKIAERLNIPRRFIGYAGIKDRSAVTTQYISIKGNYTTNLQFENFNIEFKGFSDKDIFLGSHQGNRFTITVRNIEKKPKPVELFPNYFGEQRFSEQNVELGRLILKRKYKEVIELLSKKSGDYEAKIKSHIKTHPNDFVGALRNIPKKILVLLVHSYQSYLWNKAVKKYLEGKEQADLKGKSFPIFGFGTEFEDDEIESIYEEIIKEEHLTERDFIFKDIPEISAEGESRPLMAEITDLTISDLKEDELNQGKKKCILKFSLGKGSYATVAISHLFEYEYSISL